MKIGITTLLCDSDNYGGCLQAYATEKYLLNNGYEAKHILVEKATLVTKNKESLKSKIIKELKMNGIKGVMIKGVAMIKQRIYLFSNKKISELGPIKERIQRRKASFDHFRDEVIHHTDRVYSIENIKECVDFDAYITGSDEVWRVYGNVLHPAYWLTFVHEVKKKISYAASLSMPAVPDEVKDAVRDALKDYTAISVRQNSDREAIQQLTDKPVEWVLDPTLLLTADDWLEIAAPNKFAKEKYIFTYILGDSKEQRECVEIFAKEKGLKIINIPYLQNIYRSCDRKFGDYRVSNVSPERWISLIHDAEYIFTDSFHGSVFSILFHKKFYTFLRDSHDGKGSRNSRIYSLFEMFGLKERLIDHTMTSKEIDARSDVDYENVDKILDRERKHSEDFLLGAIK